MSHVTDLPASSGSLPPDVPLEFNTDDGNTAVPDANMLFVLGDSSDDNNTDGIQTESNPIQDNNVFIVLTNRVSGAVKTVDVVTEPLIIFTPPPLVDGVYRLHFEICAYEHNTPVGTSYDVFGTVIIVGGVMTLQGIPERTISGDETVFNVELVDVTIGATDINLEVTGVLGSTISWGGLLTFRFQGELP